MTCPSCIGEKESLVFINRGEDWRNHTQEILPCRTCGGKGEISIERNRWIISGHRLRSWRLENGYTIIQAARMVGAESPVQYSAAENGTIEPYRFLSRATGWMSWA